MNYKNAIVRKPPQSMADGITTQEDVVDLQQALEQHKGYISHLQALGVSVTQLEPDEDFPDSHFVEDTAILHKNNAILTRPGATMRRGEVARIKPALEKVLTVHELGGEEDAILDGGDVLIMGNHVLIGLYDRTNLAGAQRLQAILQEVDPALEFHFIPFSGVLHLKSGLTAINNHQLVGNPKIRLEQKLDFAEITWLPEQEGYAANTLTVNGSTFHFQEAHSVHTAIRQAGNQPIPFNLSEFRKMDGSFTCLSLLW